MSEAIAETSNCIKREIDDDIGLSATTLMSTSKSHQVGISEIDKRMKAKRSHIEANRNDIGAIQVNVRLFCNI
jgi:hypothetical protein